MRVAYVPVTEREWTHHYGEQAKQSGAGFTGMQYQRGAGLGSFFRGVFRALLPIAKSAGKRIGKQALSTGAQIVSDVVAGKSIKAAAKTRGKQATAKLLAQAARKVQSGGKKRAAGKKKPTKAKRAKIISDQLGFYTK
jgi:hypothetical protein